MVEWGGLWSVTFFDTLNIPFRETGIVIGIVCGLFNQHRQDDPNPR